MVRRCTWRVIILPVGESPEKPWSKWDVESGYCPQGHLIEVCTYFDKRGYPECRIARNEKLYASGKRVKTEPEYRCDKCRAPLWAGLHVFGMLCQPKWGR